MIKKDRGNEIDPGQSFEIDLFRPQDAEAVGHCFRSVYGEAYPVKTVYLPEKLIQENASGNLYTIVARTPKGDIVGHMALFRSAPCNFVYETGQGLVLPIYRRRGINNLLFKYAFEELPPKLGIEESFGEAVTNHIINQKYVSTYGHIETAIEVDLMPVEAYAKEQSSSGRVSSLDVFRSYKPKPHHIYIPPIYKDALEFIYAELDDQRIQSPASEVIVSDAASRASIVIYDHASVARINISDIGSDFESVIRNCEKQAFEQSVIVTQVWLKLDLPSIGAAVNILRSRGYFLGGPFPRWFDTDGLLMQKIATEPNWGGIQLYSQRAKNILEIIKQDWLRVST
jgi:hypothetical protein